MIAVSDAILIVVSAAVLATGLVRWQNNVEEATLANLTGATASQALAQSSADVNADANAQIARQAGTDRQISNADDTVASNSVQGSISRDTERPAQVVVSEQAPTTAIDVAEDSATTADNEAIMDVPPYGSYLVRSGDSLSAIAIRYGTTVAVLQDINDIEGTLITVGQQLRYPLPVN